MLTLQLANLILYNLSQARLTCIVFFHCWNMQHFGTQKILSNFINNNDVFMQFVALKTIETWQDFEYHYLRHSAPTMAIFLDENCEESTNLLNVSSQARLFNQHYHWLIYDEQSNITEFRNFFEHANLSVDADLTYIQWNDNAAVADKTQSFTLYDAYNNGYHIGGKLNMTIDREIHCNLSACVVHRFLSKLHLRTKYGNREQLGDVTMRVATVVTKRPLDWPPEKLTEYLESANTTYIDSIPRFGYKLLLILQDALRFDMVQTYNDRWSTLDFIGGSVGALVNETADITSTPFLVTEGRLRHITFVAETGVFLQKCIFRTPRNANIHGDVFLNPFSPNVWYIFMGMLSVTAIFLWCTFNLEAKGMRQSWNFVPSLLTTMLITFGAACIQGSYRIPRSMGGRMAFFALLISCFIMYNYYTSVVVSSLLSAPSKSDIKTLAQLADSSLEVGLEPLPFTKAYLTWSQVPAVRRFVKRKVEPKTDPNDLWIDTEVGVIRVRDHPGYVYVFEASAGYAYVEKYYKPHEICDLNEVMLRPERFIYTGLHRNSTYKEIVRLKQTRMIETGIYRKHRNLWVRNKPRCYANNFIIDVGMEYVAPLFFILICAYVLVVIILFMEIAWHRYTTGKDKAL